MGEDSTRARLATALRHLLRPLVRVMLRHGMAYGDFAEVLKAVYVEAAREDFALPGRRSTDSRVAILTGLTRKEVRLFGEARGERQGNSANRATRVLSGWHQDPDFTAANGEPAVLALDGPCSFSELVRRHSGDIPPRALLEELKHVGAVRIEADGRVRVLSRAFVPNQGDAEGLRMLGTAVHDLAATIEHNLARERGEPAFFQRSAFSERFPVRNLPILRRIVAERGQRFLESLDDWMGAHERDARKRDDPEADVTRTGVGLYFFQDPPARDEGGKS